MKEIPGEEGEICSICMEPPKDRTTTNKCKHAFCEQCIRRWCRTQTKVLRVQQQNKRKCPVCRRSFQRLKQGNKFLPCKKKPVQRAPVRTVFKQIIYIPTWQNNCLVPMPYRIPEQLIQLPIMPQLFPGITVGSLGIPIPLSQ